MAINYQLQPNESIDAYNTRIARERGETTAPTANLNTVNTREQVLAESTRVAQEAAKMIGTTFTPGNISNPAPTPTTGAISGATPELPKPQSSTIQDQFITSLSADLERQRKQLQDTYTKQQEEAKIQAEASQKQIDEINQKYKDTLEQAKPLTEPFRQKLEETERQRLYITENFEANQKLTSELDTLLTEGNNLIKQQQGLAIPDVFRTARVNKTINDINARTGVIQAVMNARNGQIGQAYTMIDRTTDAITADRKDQLDYFNTLLSFYSTQKDDEGKKLLTLTKDQKDYMDKQISLLESDLQTTQANADFIKEAMIDPDTAQAYGQAGITLNDSPQEINRKLSEYSYSQEVTKTSNDMAGNGYSYLAPGQSAPSGYDVINTTDSKGNVKQWYREKKETETPTDIKAENYDLIKQEAIQLFEADSERNQDGKIDPDLYQAVRDKIPATLKDDFDRWARDMGYLSEETTTRFGIIPKSSGKIPNPFE